MFISKSYTITFNTLGTYYTVDGFVNAHTNTKNKGNAERDDTKRAMQITKGPSWKVLSAITIMSDDFTGAGGNVGGGGGGGGGGKSKKRLWPGLSRASG